MTDQANKKLIGINDLGEFDPGLATLEAMRRSEHLGRFGRRTFLTALGAAATYVAATPSALAQTRPGPTPLSLDTANNQTYPPQHSAKVMDPVNVHEIQAVSEKNLDFATYEYITGGAEAEYTLRDNVNAYRKSRLRQRVGVDVSKIDMSLEVLGKKLDYPIMLDPTIKNPVA